MWVQQHIEFQPDIQEEKKYDSQRIQAVIQKEQGRHLKRLSKHLLAIFHLFEQAVPCLFPCNFQ
jgi:hypothetical protein